MRAIVLAAGEGRRLLPYTRDRPKCMVELKGRPLLIRQLDVLERCGIRDVTIVTGYRAEGVDSHGHATRYNPHFATTNMVASLMCVRDLLDGAEDVIIA